ncbi:MAG TPA: hypothetical protein VGP18_10650 [Solirubrobacteraceae bacterium]|jgi:hypothetical protein|nr:hypothetical protein [Solirubrobacteraceae bacterium]
MTRTILTPAMLAAALAIAGCGGSSSSPGVAHLGSSTSSSADPASSGSSSAEGESSASAQQKIVAFSHCMRTHGVPEFPEPSEGHVLIRRSDHNGHVTGVNPQSAQFQAASKACAKLSPKGGKPPSPAEQAKLQEQALKFSQCMRTHGVPSFPDPQFSSSGVGGGIRIGGKQGGPSRIDLSSPQFQAAQKACQSIMPGPKGGPGNVALAP